jgi:hypothetical protein
MNRRQQLKITADVVRVVAKRIIELDKFDDYSREAGRLRAFLSDYYRPNADDIGNLDLIKIIKKSVDAAKLPIDDANMAI